MTFGILLTHSSMLRAMFRFRNNHMTKILINILCLIISHVGIRTPGQHTCYLYKYEICGMVKFFNLSF